MAQSTRYYVACLLIHLTKAQVSMKHIINNILFFQKVVLNAYYVPHTMLRILQ